MNIKPISHYYGDIVLKTQLCPDCKSRSFVRDGYLVCCGKPAELAESTEFKVEVDRTNARRRVPSKRDQNAILESQEGCCFYCGDHFGAYRKLCGKYRRVSLQWDHVIPFSFNGNNHEFVAACAECNQSKANRWFLNVEEARTFLTMRIHEKKKATK